jgi:hypothetical protein
MTSNIAQFNASIGRFAEKDVPRAVQDATMKLGLQALRGVVLKTPVDTGRARGNWFTTLTQPSARVSDNTDPSGREAIQRGTGTITSVQPFGKIWITNNLPYIQPLEDGHSGQAPNGMVATTVAEIQSQFRRID